VFLLNNAKFLFAKKVHLLTFLKHYGTLVDLNSICKSVVCLLISITHLCNWDLFHEFYQWKSYRLTFASFICW